MSEIESVCVCVLTYYHQVSLCNVCVCLSFILNSFACVLAAGCSLTCLISDKHCSRLLASVCVLHDEFQSIKMAN